MAAAAADHQDACGHMASRNLGSHRPTARLPPQRTTRAVQATCVGSDSDPGAVTDNGCQLLDHHMHSEDESPAAYIPAADTLVLALAHFHAVWWLDAALIVSSAHFRPVGRQHSAAACLIALDHSPASVWVSIGVDLLEQLL